MTKHAAAVARVALKDVVESIDLQTTNNLRINVPKSHVYFRRTLYLLGHTFSGQGITLDKRKLEDVHAWPRHTSGKQIESYLQA